MKARGQEFLKIPDSYYEQLREKLKSAKITVAEDMDTVRKIDGLHVCMHGRLAGSQKHYWQFMSPINYSCSVQ